MQANNPQAMITLFMVLIRFVNSSSISYCKVTTHYPYEPNKKLRIFRQKLCIFTKTPDAGDISTDSATQ